MVSGCADGHLAGLRALAAAAFRGEHYAATVLAGTELYLHQLAPQKQAARREIRHAPSDARGSAHRALPPRMEAVFQLQHLRGQHGVQLCYAAGCRRCAAGEGGCALEPDERSGDADSAFGRSVCAGVDRLHGSDDARRHLDGGALALDYQEHARPRAGLVFGQAGGDDGARGAEHPHFEYADCDWA
ncbi:hypothetical protein SDC9_164787 [bioreactor metagenome]|uniref:Uncharacterized protein n=1 Tax=bioreactor metagenome TaxID=1076179 RepID=A0A645FZZ3_9ZZZZ